MAVNNPTTRFGWVLPVQGGSAGTWGTVLNEVIGQDAGNLGIDEELWAVKTTADAALPKAGGAMTGRIDVKNAAHTVVDLGSLLSGSVNCDLSTATVFRGIATGNVTFTFSNIPTGGVFVVIELQTSSMPHTISWPAGLTFAQDSLKTLVATKIQVFSLFTRNGGTDWRAVHLANMDL